MARLPILKWSAPIFRISRKPHRMNISLDKLPITNDGNESEFFGKLPKPALDNLDTNLANFPTPNLPKRGKSAYLREPQ